MIEVKNLVFSYPGSKHKVFDGLNLTLKENRIYGLLGKNGMGKSTFALPYSWIVANLRMERLR